MTSPNRSPFAPEELAAWRRRLVEHARSLSADVAALIAEAVPQERVGPNYHITENGSELQTAQIDASESAADRDVLRSVERAVAKIDTGLPLPFGLCEVSGREIERERLELMPWTPVCAEVGEDLERQGVAVEDALPLP